MSSLSKELVFLILQFLDEEKFKETVHMLEKESGFFFNMKYFEDLVTNGEWDELENYVSGFTKLEDNRYSMKIFFEIRKQKYLEALDRREHAKAVEILLKDLKFFSTANEDLFKEITMLLTLKDFRENAHLSKYGDTKNARATMCRELKSLIEGSPVFRDKLLFPPFKSSRLRTLINQSLNWQHQLCQNQKPNPDIKTLYVDHSCGPPAQMIGTRLPFPVTNHLAGSMPIVGGFPPLGAHGPFQHAPADFTAPLAAWMANQSSMPQQTVSGAPMGLAAPNNADNPAAMVKRPRPAIDNPAVDFQTADSDLTLRRTRPFAVGDEANTLPVTFPGLSHTPTSYSADDLPKILVANLNQGSAVKSIDFHPLQLSLLLVGTNVGDVSIWEVAGKERLAYRNFRVWELPSCSATLQAYLAREYTASVNRVMWSPDGNHFGVAYSKHIVHIYSYLGGTELRNHLEIEAHAGSVNDLAFANVNNHICVITCGDDKTVKVWNATTGARLFTFEGHEAPVYSVYPHFKENIQFLFSTAVDGRIKAWVYDNKGSRIDYDAPGRSCTVMAYSADGTRLFSCGTNKEGESFLVEWDESDGVVKRSYAGLGKRSVGVVQFDTTRNRLLVAGDEFSVKFWDVDNANLLTSIDAEGGLPASPCVRFNKEGLLLAVSTNDNGIKVLANTDGVRQLLSIESRIESSRATSGFLLKNGDSRGLPDVKPNVELSKVTEITEPSQLRSLRLPDQMLPVRIMRLMYTISGSSLLSLAYNATHKLWKWQRNERNVTGKATTNVAPQMSIPSTGILMTNEIGSVNPQESVPCFALSKNDSYVMSASGGRISLFNMLNYKTMTTFMPAPPAATSLAFHPKDNNIITMGMEDSTIQIYNIRTDEINFKLTGHQGRVTGLAFSDILNILVSSGADSQLYVWSIDSWARLASTHLQIPSGRSYKTNASTRVQFDRDQVHVLAVHPSHVALYEVPKLECLKQWFPPQESSGEITDATYSCDSQLIYVASQDGSVSVIVASTLALRCIINPTAYLLPNPRAKPFPMCLAAHPIDPNHLAVGLSDGGVLVLEPHEAEGRWGAPPSENGAGPSGSSATVASV